MILEGFLTVLQTLSAAKLDMHEKTRPVIVAVIDTGVDTHHPALASRLWTNPGETGRDAQGRDKETNHVDDDGNGYIDDVHGWNFARGNTDIHDEMGHGTHISGLIAAHATSSERFHGLAPNARIMVLKYLDPRDPPIDSIRSTVEAINYAVKMHAEIINYSAGGTQPSPEERAAIQNAEKHGILFVAAAGNEHSNSDHSGYYPADYGLSNILSVTAVDRAARILPTSNYGARTVDLAVVGKDIPSTLPGGGYGHMTGTSQATALASAAAARLLGERTLTPSQLIRILSLSGQFEPWYRGKVKHMTRMDVARAESMRTLSEDAFDQPAPTSTP